MREDVPALKRPSCTLNGSMFKVRVRHTCTKVIAHPSCPVDSSVLNVTLAVIEPSSSNTTSARSCITAIIDDGQLVLHLHNKTLKAQLKAPVASLFSSAEMYETLLDRILFVCFIVSRL